MTTRRKVILLLGALASLPAFAQKQERVRRIGYYAGNSLQSSAGYLTAFRAGMAELHWVEGRDYTIDARYANGVAQAMPGITAQLVATKPDLLLTNADEGVRQLARRTKTIPIVFAVSQDPLANRVVASLQRPGGNATGLTVLAVDLGPKRLQLLIETFPQVAHVVVLLDAGNLGSLSQAQEIEAAGERMKIRVTAIELRQAADIEPAFKRGTSLGAQAYVLTAGPLLATNRLAIVDRLLRSKIPAISSGAEYTEAGGLMSYGPSNRDNFRRAAAYVDKIFKGAKASDLPVEQPTHFEMLVNLKTAKAMGLSIPQSILLRADRVIE